MNLARLGHIERHIRPNHRVFIPLFCEPLTQVEIAQRIGPGWTVRQVEVGLLRITEALWLFDVDVRLRRLKLLRMCAGIEPCFCEVEE